MTQRVLWAVDPFNNDAGFQKHFLKALRPVVLAMKAQVEPVYVLNQEPLSSTNEIMLPAIETYKVAAEKTMFQLMKEIDLPGLLEPTVIVQSSPSSNAKAIRALEAHALSTNADLIAVATHAKRGLPRLFLGSFAESLLQHSRIAVLSINPTSRSFPKSSNILFPTDFSDASQTAFHDAMELASSFGGSLTIYHYLANSLEPMIQSGAYLLGGGWMDLSPYISEDTDQQKRKAQEWREIARQKGLDVEIVSESGKGSIVDAILAYAESNPVSLIAMSAQSGPFASFIIGSVTQQVVRNAPCPVWVHRKHDAKESRAA